MPGDDDRPIQDAGAYPGPGGVGRTTADGCDPRRRRGAELVQAPVAV